MTERLSDSPKSGEPGFYSLLTDSKSPVCCATSWYFVNAAIKVEERQDNQLKETQFLNIDPVFK